MKKLGTILLLFGMAVIPVFWGAGLWAFLTSPEVPVMLKVAAISFASGALLLAVASLKDNWGEKDKYNEVKQ